MQTCKLMHCPHLGKCHLCEEGATDLCPVLSQIKEEATMKTIHAWEEVYPAYEEVPLERFHYSHTTAVKGFTLKVGLSRMAYLEFSRKDATLKDAAQHNKFGTVHSSLKREFKKRGPTKKQQKKMAALPNTVTRAEAYSVYDYKETPPTRPKVELIKTRQERWEVADRKERNRAFNIRISEQLVIERLFNMLK